MARTKTRGENMSIQITPSMGKPVAEWGLKPVFSDEVYEDILTMTQNGYRIITQKIVFSRTTLEPRLIIVYYNKDLQELLLKSYNPNGNVVGTKTFSGIDYSPPASDFSITNPWYFVIGNYAVVFDSELNQVDTTDFSQPLYVVRTLLLDENTTNIDSKGETFIINGVKYKITVTCLDSSCTTKIYRDDTEIHSLNYRINVVYIASGKVVIPQAYIIPDETTTRGNVPLGGNKHLCTGNEILFIKYNDNVVTFYQDMTMVPTSFSDYEVKLVVGHCYKGICGEGIVDLKSNRVYLIVPRRDLNALMFYYELG